MGDTEANSKDVATVLEGLCNLTSFLSLNSYCSNELDLYDTCCTETLALCDLLRTGAEFEKINVSCNTDDSKSLALGPALKENGTIRSLDFDSAPGTSSDLAVQIIADSATPWVESLAVMDIHFEPKSNNSFAATLPRLSALAFLKITWCEGISASQLVLAICGIRSLVMLHLCGNKFGDRLAQPFSSDSALEEASLHFENNSVEGAKVIGVALSNGGARRLYALDMENNTLTDAGVAAIVSGLAGHRMTMLCFESTEAGSNGGTRLAELLEHTSRLDELNISENSDMGNDVGTKIGRALAASAGTIRAMHISNCGFKEAATSAIFRSLGCTRRSRVEFLAIDECTIGNLGAKAISEFLSVARTLKSLIAYDCGIDEKQGREIARSISAAWELKTLHLSYNSFRAGAAVALLDAFRKDSALEELHLSSCQIGDPGAEALGRLARRSSNIRRLFLKKCGIGEAGIAALTAGLLDSDSVNILVFDGNPIEDSGVRLVSERLIAKSQTLTQLKMRGMKIGTAVAKAVAMARTLMERREQMLELQVNEELHELQEFKELDGKEVEMCAYICYMPDEY